MSAILDFSLILEANQMYAYKLQQLSLSFFFKKKKTIFITT